MTEPERLEAMIRSAFAEVTREGGISWAEGERIDLGEWATHIDKDEQWTDLIDDPDWDFDVGVGGMNFLDAIGFRYYLAAALVQEVRGNESEKLPWRLELPRVHGWLLRKVRIRRREHTLMQWSLLTHAQKLAIVEVVRWAAARERETSEQSITDWQKAWESYWRDYSERPSD